MALYDILYLDDSRLASLASQLSTGLADVAFVRSTRAIETSTEHSQRADTSGNLAASTDTIERVVRVADDRLSEFLRRIEPSTIDLTVDDATARKESARALSSGALVRATGRFFCDDFRWLQDEMARMAVVTKIWAELTGDPAAAKMLPPAEQFEGLGKLVAILYGDSIECGAALGDGTSGLLVRAAVTRAALRQPPEVLLERYGNRSQSRFTMVGTVSRLGWSEPVYLTNGERDASAMGGFSPLNPSASPLLGMQSAQGAMMALRRQLFAGYEERSVYIAPLAIYREIPMQAEVTPPPSA